MIRILFVDDEKMILKGLRRMLFAYQDEWEVAFAARGDEALEQMAVQTFDVIVSDMRMPEMNGNQLLKEVSQRHPNVIRIILSGHADRHLIIESTRHAHQYLTKPCDAEELKATIDRCCQREDLNSQPELIALVSSLPTIPSLPALYTELVAMVESESWNMDDAAAVIAMDVGMTAKILQLVNSAFFGMPRHIACVSDAVGLLGIDTIKSLALSVKLFSQFPADGNSGLNFEQVTAHNLSTGCLARLIAQAENAPRCVIDHALLAGSLHDAGRLILAANKPDDYAKALALMDDESLSLPAAELQIFGADHAALAAYMMNLWGLPEPIIEAIAHHHVPGTGATEGFTALTAVHIADAFESAIDTPSDLDEAYIADLGLSHRISAWRGVCQLATTAESQ